MSRIIYFEWKKIMTQGRLLMFVLLLLTGQFILFWYDEIDNVSVEEISYSSYVSLAEDIRSGKMTEEEVLNRAEDLGNITCTYTNSQLKEETLFREMAEELKQIRQYPEYIDNIFQEEDAFILLEDNSVQKIKEKVRNDFKTVQNVKPYFCGAYGISLLTGSKLQDFLVVLVFLLLAVGIVSDERESQTEILLHSMAKGRKIVGTGKFLMGIFASVLIVLLVYAGRIILIALSYGVGDWSAPIQSVPGFMSCAWKISIGEYIGLFLLLKVIAGMMLFTFCLFCVNIFMEAWKAFMVTIIGAGLFYFLYQGIASTDWLAVIKWYNPFAFFDSGRIIAEYQAKMWFTYPIRYSTVCIVICLLCVIVFGIWNICLYERSPLNKRGGTTEKILGLRKFRIKMGAFTGELYKCFICQKGAALFCCMMLFVIILVPPVEEQLMDINDVYYRNYVKQNEGKFSEEKLNGLYAEREKIAANEKRLETENLTLEAADVLNQDVQRKYGLKRAISYGEYLKKYSDTDFVYDVGYKEWMGISQQTGTLFYMHMVAVLLAVVLCVSVWWIEESTGMAQLITISAMGMKKIVQIKKKAVFVNCILVWGVFFGYFTYQIWREYGFSGLNASAHSMRFFSGFPSWIRIWQVVLVVYLLKLVYLIGTGLGIRFIAEKKKSYLFTAVISSVVFLIPVVTAHLFFGMFI